MRVARGLTLHLHSARRLVWSPLRTSSDHRSSIISLEGELDWSPTARVQRGSSETARCTSTGDHQACPLILLPSLLVTLFKGWPGSVPTCARRTTNIMVPPSSLVPSQGWGLIDLPLRAFNEGSPRPRVARAQKIIRLHPLSVPRAQIYISSLQARSYFLSKGVVWFYPLLRALTEHGP